MEIVVRALDMDDDGVTSLKDFKVVVRELPNPGDLVVDHDKGKQWKIEARLHDSSVDLLTFQAKPVGYLGKPS